MDRSKVLILLSLVAVAAILGAVATTAYAADDEAEGTNGFCGWGRGWLGGRGPRGLRGEGRHRFIEVSEEFEETAINIAKSDGDVQGLLDDGYSIAGVRPIIKTRVEANGDVATKATSAVVMLEKEDTTSFASAWVDLEEGKVTQIVILTRTVIEKA